MKSIGHNDFISTKDNSNDGETKSGATKILLGDLKAGETKYVTIELGVQEPAEEINIVSKVSAKMYQSIILMNLYSMERK